MHEHLDALRVADVATFLTVFCAGSVTVAARQLGVTPSQVSKAIARLEAFLKLRLVARSGRGIELTEDAKAMRAEMEELVRRVEELPKPRTITTTSTIAAPSYLALRFFAPLARKLGDVRVRAIEAGASTIRAYAEEGTIEMALTLSAERLPSAWASSNAFARCRS